MAPGLNLKWAMLWSCARATTAYSPGEYAGNQLHLFASGTSASWPRFLRTFDLPRLPNLAKNLAQTLSDMSQTLVFVATDGAGKLTACERKIVRRHCVRGKNKKPTSRRSRREAARSTAVSKPGLEPTCALHDQDFATTPTPKPTRAAAPPAPSSSTTIALHSCIHGSGVGNPTCPLALDLALVTFASPLEATSQKLVHECTSVVTFRVERRD